MIEKGIARVAIEQMGWNGVLIGSMRRERERQKTKGDEVRLQRGGRKGARELDRTGQKLPKSCGAVGQ